MDTGLLLIVLGVGLLGFIAERTLVAWLLRTLHRMTAPDAAERPSPRVQRVVDSTTRVLAPVRRAKIINQNPPPPPRVRQPAPPSPRRANQTTFLRIDGDI